MIFRLILIFIIIVFVVRFILRFVMPIFQISRLTQDKLKQMQQQMEDMHNPNKSGAKSKPERSSQIDGEYIDYEEVK